MAESFDIELGNPLPLSLTAPDGVSGLFPRARIYDSSDVEVAGSPFNLTEVGGTGRYTGASFTPLAVGTFTARFVIYTDAGHTTESQFYERDQDSYRVADVDALVWDATQSDHVASGTTGRAQLLALYENAVWIDTGNGAAGTVLGVNGTPDNPVDNLADAVTLAASLGVRRYNIRKTSGGPLTLTSSHDDWQFVGVGEGVVVALAGQDVDGTLFENVELSGISNGSIRANRCSLDGVTELEGLITNGWFKNAIAMPVAGAGFLVVHNCASGEPGPLVTPTLAVGGAGNEYNIRSYSGGIEVTGSGVASNIGTIELVAGQIILGATMTAGLLAVRGVGFLDDSSIGAITLDKTGFIQESRVVDAVWDELLTGATHNIQTSAGRRLRQLEEGVVLHEGTAQAATVNTITLDAGAVAIDDFYMHTRILIVENTGDEQERIVVAYVGATRVATIAPAWVVIPDSTSNFEVGPGLTHAETNSKTVEVGIAQSATASSITLATTASAVDGFHVNNVIIIDTGTGEGQERIINAYDGTTKVADVEPDWTITPDATSEYIIEVALSVADVHFIEGADPADTIADAVWDEDTVSHSAPGSFGSEVLGKAEPGDAMDLIADALDSSSLASSAVSEITGATDTVLTLAHGAGAWTTASVAALQATVDRIEGIVGHNHVLAALTKNANGDMLTGRIRHYNTEANADTDNGATGLLNTYIITATYDVNNSLDSFTMTRSGS